EINYKVKSNDFVTRLYAYGKDGMSFASINGGLPYVENNTYSNKVICAVWRDERYTIPENLLSDAKKNLAAMAVPSRSYDCDVVDLAATNPEMYRIQDFSIFRVATLIDDAKNFAINYQVVERWDYPYYPESNKVIFSSSPAKIQNQVTHITQQVENPNSSFRQQQQAAINNATSWLTSADGYVVAVKDDNGAWKELLFLDTPDASTAKNVLRINTNGIGFSTTGVNGPYKNAWTIDGSLVADFITSGTINAAFVKIINLIADHVVSQSGRFTMSVWAATLKMLENENLRVRIYTTDNATGGRVQVFSGTVTDVGGLGEDAYYSYLGPEGIGVGERKDGSYTGAVSCGRINVNGDVIANGSVNANGNYTNAADTWRMTGKNGSVILRMEGTERTGYFDKLSIAGGAAQNVEWVYDNLLGRYVLCTNY
ncbi:phage tail spike protein, partial [Ruthenibacterium lactatiformans]|uniref:phage tail spike protein n=1 Tax=Ruthenibacterium lactatiformans TaxID=1550024 RepID=UPI0026720D6E